MGIYRKLKRATPWWLKIDFRHTKPLFIMCLIEFPFTIATLALYGIADPDTYRTALWTQGAQFGWNSDPIEILYSYANYAPIQPPAPWNQFITNFNVIISVFSMFVLLGKTVCYILNLMPPVISVLLHAVLTVLYAYSISQQLAPDYSDPTHPSTVPWMFTHGCGPPVIQALQGFCQQAQASVAVAALQCALFFAFLVYSVYMAFPTKEQRETIKQKEQEELEEYDDKRVFELGEWPASPGSPMFPMTPITPRTMAFQTLDGAVGAAAPQHRPINRDLPLRQHIAMDDKEIHG